MSWLTKTIRKHVPSTRNKSYDIKTGISNFTNTVTGVFDKKHRENFDQATDIFSSGVTKLGNNIFAQEGDSLFAGGSRFLSSVRDLGPDGYERNKDIFKGQPNLPIPNIPQPGTGAIDYLNARTKQLGYVQDKLEMLNAYGNEGIMEGGRFAGDVVERLKGNPALLLAGPFAPLIAGYQTAAKNYMNKGKGDGEVTAEATSDPASKIVKGSGSLLGKSAKFVTNKSGKNRGRSSLKIGRGGTGGGQGADHFKSYRSGRRSGS